MSHIVFARILVAAAALAGVVIITVGTAQAQYRDDDRYFMLRDPFRGGGLFGSERRPAPPPPVNLPPRPAPVEPPSDQPTGAVYNSKVDADKDRSSSATEYVLVLGDTLADQLAQGLADAFVADRPEVAIVRKTKASSGFTRADFYNWPAQIPALIAAEKPSAIAIMLGSNDRQTLRDEGGAFEPRTDRWREIYSKRVDEALSKLKEKGAPVFVVGAPPMRGTQLSQGMEYINEIFRERAERAGVIYVDIWDGFIDDRGDFMAIGPALDGQKRRLRIADGVHFTKAGGRKLAHYVERDLIRLFDFKGARGPQLPQESPMIPTEPISPSLSGRPVSGPVVPLNQPVGSGQLAGSGSRSASPALDTSASRVLVDGMPTDPVAGRADDFRWRSSTTSAPAIPIVAPPLANAAPAPLNALPQSQPAPETVSKQKLNDLVKHKAGAKTKQAPAAQQASPPAGSQAKPVVPAEANRAR